MRNILLLVRSSLVLQGIAVWVLSAALLLLWPDLLQNLLVTRGYEPHAHCYNFEPRLVWLHATSDFAIGTAYVAISSTLAYLVYRARQEIPFHWMFLAFGVFIIACGTTHFMEVVTLWSAPVYWLAGYIKLITAVASVATAVVLPPIIPVALSLVRAAQLSEQRKVQLESANQELEALYEKSQEVDQLKTQFFANVSHELRTPLALILGPTEKLLSAGQLDDDQRRSLELVDRNARSLLKHVNDLLDVSKLAAGQMAVNYAADDLARMVRVAAANFESLAQERAITLAVEAPSTLPAHFDVEKLRRVILNLLSNAFKFAPDGGTIRCIVEPVEDGAARRARLAVCDSGPGVPPHLRQAIFERFRQGEGGTTRRFGGTGLGLAIVKDFVELHRGTVSVGEAPEGGAEFIVEMPLEAPPEVTVGATSGATPGAVPAGDEMVELTVEQLRPAEDKTRRAGEWESGRGERESGRAGETAHTSLITVPPLSHSPILSASAPLVLVVEDNLDMNRFVSETLGQEYRVASAVDGQDGLEKALELRPDLILSDMMMPRLSGDQLLRAVRARDDLAWTPFIMLTAKADDQLRVDLLREGAQDYLMKPFSVEELRVRVGNQVAIKRTRDVLQQTLESRSHDLEGLAQEVATRRQELQSTLESLRTSEERVRHALTEAELASRAKDEFLAILSHELRTPLHAMLGWISLLRSGRLDEATAVIAMETIERNTHTQTQLVEDILDVSRIITGNLTLRVVPVLLGPVIESALMAVWPAAEAKTIEVQTHLDPAVGPVSGDAHRLQQVVWNLVSNAIKFTPKEGRVEVRLQRTASQAEIIVSDTGIGIDRKFLPHIFERFRQADSSTTRTFGGLGLGLAIVRHLVELHGGTVTAYSEGADRGTTFTVRLPLLSVLRAGDEQAGPADGGTARDGARPQPGEESTETDVSLLAGLRVLVVDDETDARQLIAHVIEESGAEVTAVASVAAAMAALERGDFDVLVSDISMPDADGYDLIRRLREREAQRGGHLPAAALTAHARAEDRLRVLAAGFQLHLSKPIEPTELVTAVARLAGRNH